MTEYDPAVAFAVNVVDATPDASVLTEMVVEPLLNVPDAPPGAVNVMLKPCIGLLSTSSTFTESGVVNAVLTSVD